jgi:hypothetical protein
VPGDEGGPWTEVHVLYGDGGVTGRQTDHVWVHETAW